MMEFNDALMKAKTSWSIVFVQYGKIPSALNLMSTCGDTAFELVDAKDLVGGQHFPNYQDETVLIDRVDRIINTQPNGLGTLRAYVDSLTTNGCRVILSSKKPRSSYPRLVGSEVIADSKPLRFSFSEAQIQQIQSLIQSDQNFLVEALRELDFSTVDNLSSYIWSGGEEPAFSELPPMATEALLGAGILNAGDSDQLLHPLFPIHVLRDAATAVSAASTEGGASGARCYEEIWFIERTLRNKIREWLIDFGSTNGQSWREMIHPNQLKSKIVERAQVGAFPHVNKIKELQDPLEWLTLGELLDLRVARNMGDLGMPSQLWGLLKQDIVPLRNKITHMRQVAPTDLETARRWRRRVEWI